MDFDSMPDQSPDRAPAGKPAALPSFDDMQDQSPVPSFDAMPDQAESTYGTPGQQALAGVEGLARGVTLGGSDVAERALGLSTPEAMRARRDVNPWTSTLASIGGGGAAAALTGGGSLIAEGLGGGALAGAIGLGTEGAVFGAGNAVSEAALGDPDLNAQKFLSHVGWGTVLGAGLGAVVGKLGGFAGKAAEDIAAAGTEGEPVFAETGPQRPFTSYQDGIERLAKASQSGQAFELPGKAVLLDADSRLQDLQHPLLPQQIDAVGNTAKRVTYQILRDEDTEVGHFIKELEGTQKREMNAAIDDTIQSLSPRPVSTDEVVNGNKAVQFFTDQYQTAKKTYGEMFDDLDKIHLGPLRADIVPLMETLNRAFLRLAPKDPLDITKGLSQIFEYGADGLPKEVNAFDPGWGVSNNAYNAVKSVFTSLENGIEEPTSFQYLRNLRDSMSDHLSLGDQRGNGQILSLKAGFMDYLQELADEHVPDLELRKMFKGYAINEQSRETIEKTFGASVGNPDFARIAKPREDILGKIFNNSETVKAAQRILPPHQFDELLANRLAELKFARTKNGVFSSNTFFNSMKTNRAALGQAFANAPQKLQRINDLLTRTMIVPDAASINPSGTAKTTVGMVQNLLRKSDGMDALLTASSVLNPKALIGLIGRKFYQAMQESRAATSRINNFNAGLMGEAAKTQSLEATQKIISAVNANLDRSARAIFKQEPANAR